MTVVNNQKEVGCLILALRAVLEHLFNVETLQPHIKLPHSHEINNLFLDCNFCDLSLSNLLCARWTSGPLTHQLLRHFTS